MIPFNKPYMTGQEIKNIADAHARGHLAGDGYYTKQCHAWLEERVGCKKALLTHSCTAALEIAAIVAGLKEGDEVIMPSYTFVSTANAFALRGAVPVFVDIRPDTLNIDETKIEAAITSKTKVIVPVHYAGVACEMDTIMAIAEKYQLLVIEDAAQGVCANYKGRPLGSIGHMGAFSFHETKNVISGEGGALLINDPRFIEVAEIAREKGTNRSRFFRGEVDKYTWVDIGSSYLPGEVIAAFLFTQLNEAEAITQKRKITWQQYHDFFEPYEKSGRLRRPSMPETAEANAHMYYILLKDVQDRTAFIAHMKSKGIHCVFHYVPLHSSPAGKRFGRVSGEMTNTEKFSKCLVRLPLWVEIEPQMSDILAAAQAFLGKE